MSAPGCRDSMPQELLICHTTLQWAASSGGTSGVCTKQGDPEAGSITAAVSSESSPPISACGVCAPSEAKQIWQDITQERTLCVIDLAPSLLHLCFNCYDFRAAGAAEPKEAPKGRSALAREADRRRSWRGFDLGGSAEDGSRLADSRAWHARRSKNKDRSTPVLEKRRCARVLLSNQAAVTWRCF